MSTPTTFPVEVAEQLACYVYRLVDPRNGETFYVGKGTGNRIFDHVRGAIPGQDEDAVSAKIGRIRAVEAAGLEVIHIIHRHGMNEDTAFQVEAALIDAYPGTTNLAGGTGSNDFGPMNVAQIIQKYGAEEAQFSHRCLLLSVDPVAAGLSLYEVTRRAWRLDPERARRAECILAVDKGLILAAFAAEEWLPVTAENFPGFPEVPGRWGFVGKVAPVEVANAYVGRRIPASLRKKGASNPVRYGYE